MKALCELMKSLREFALYFYVYYIINSLHIIKHLINSKDTKMKKSFIAIDILVLLFCASGCGTTAKFVYPAHMETMVQINDSPVF